MKNYTYGSSALDMNTVASPNYAEPNIIEFPAQDIEYLEPESSSQSFIERLASKINFAENIICGDIKGVEYSQLSPEDTKFVFGLFALSAFGLGIIF